MKKCSRCGVEKPFSEFHKDKSRKDNHGRYCKLCKSDYDKHGNHKKYKDKYIVYYLPKENYIGMTFNYRRRLNSHKNKGNKNIKDARVLFYSKSEKAAHFVESLLHLLGFKGFRY